MKETADCYWDFSQERLIDEYVNKPQFHLTHAKTFLDFIANTYSHNTFIVESVNLSFNIQTREKQQFLTQELGHNARHDPCTCVHQCNLWYKTQKLSSRTAGQAARLTARLGCLGGCLV